MCHEHITPSRHFIDLEVVTSVVSITTQHDSPHFDPVQGESFLELGGFCYFFLLFSLLLSLQRGDRALAGRKRALFVT